MGWVLGLKTAALLFVVVVVDGWGWETGCGVGGGRGGGGGGGGGAGDVLLIQPTHSGTLLAALLLLIQHRRTFPTVLSLPNTQRRVSDGMASIPHTVVHFRL